MDDNLSLSEKIKERYRSMYTGVFYRRYIRGLWAMAEGIIYDMFDTAKHVISNLSDLVNENYYVSCDYGTQNATVFLLWCKSVLDGGCVAGSTIIPVVMRNDRKQTQNMQMTWSDGLVV